MSKDIGFCHSQRDLPKRYTKKILDNTTKAGVDPAKNDPKNSSVEQPK